MKGDFEPNTHNPETCDECIIARQRGHMDKEGYNDL